MSAEAVITDSNFDAEVLKSAIPVMVDFWAPWCGPCRMLGPLIEELAGEYAGKIKVGKLNTDENPSVAGNFRINSIPTVIFFKDGQAKSHLTGLQSKAELKKQLDALL
ncbi:MAG: thioredoxin [bacterium]